MADPAIGEPVVDDDCDSVVSAEESEVANCGEPGSDGFKSLESM